MPKKPEPLYLQLVRIPNRRDQLILSRLLRMATPMRRRPR